MHTHPIPTPNINLPGSFQAALAPGGQVVLRMDWVQTQVLNAKRHEMRKLDVFKMTTWATSYIDHLTLTDEWGGAHVWWARFGGSWKVFHRFFETLHLVLHTGLKEANTQTLEWPATKFKFCHVWEFNLVPSMKERGCLTVMFEEVQMLTRVCGSRDGCVKWT